MLLPRFNMMIRENARLLFLYALRSNASCEEALRPHEWNFRLARKGDIGAIRDCNLRTLPENYTPQFYETHMGDWPELALVAEHVKRNGGDHAEVVGYVLGRMEDTRHSACIRDSRITLKTTAPAPTPTGHVTSLAVLPAFRRCGVAQQLMTNLHEQMEHCYNAKKVSLHVRKSNRGAIRLYEQVLGYSVDSVAKGYYSDGEDAYLMQVELPVEIKMKGGSCNPNTGGLSSLQPSAEGNSEAEATTIDVVSLPSLEPDREISSSSGSSNSTVGGVAVTPVLETLPPVMRAAAGPRLGGGEGGGEGGGGGGGGGGMGDRGGVKGGIPVGHPFRPVWRNLPRRPGVGCGGRGAEPLCRELAPPGAL